MVPISGNIDHLRLVGNSIELAGWCMCHQPAWIRGYEVTVDGSVGAIEGMQMGMPSPDLVKPYAELSASAAARFAMRIAAPSARDGALIRVRPVVSAGGRAIAMTSVLNPTLEMPPNDRVDFIGGDFHRTAMEFLGYYIDIVGLSPDARVLDVGCGFGRMAYGLSHYLVGNGTYHGIDVMADAIRYCSNAISKHNQRFRFTHVDVNNGMYNPGGVVQADRVVFPDQDVDFLNMTSVVTHLMVDATRRYLDEAARCLKRGGKALITAFVVDGDAKRLVEAHKASAALRWSAEHGCWLDNQDLKERVVGFDEADILHWFDAAGFDLVSGFPGRWSGRRPALSYQDMFVLQKR